MSNRESNFIKWLAGILIPVTLVFTFNAIITISSNRNLKKTVETTTDNVEYIRKYYMTTQDFWDYADAQKELYNAQIEGNAGRIERLEKQLDDFRNQFSIKTRGLTSQTIR